MLVHSLQLELCPIINEATISQIKTLNKMMTWELMKTEVHKYKKSEQDQPDIPLDFVLLA